MEVSVGIYLLQVSSFLSPTEDLLFQTAKDVANDVFSLYLSLDFDVDSEMPMSPGPHAILASLLMNLQNSANGGNEPSNVSP